MSALWAAIQRLETLIKLALARPVASVPITTTTQAVVRDLPNNNVATTIASVPVNLTHPILIETTFMVKDKVLDRCSWSTLRSEVNGNTAGATFLTTASEFLINQPGLVNPPTYAMALGAGNLTLEARVTNPLAANVVDVEVTMVVQVSQAG